jgi:uncharacterized membrane protein
MRLIANFNNCFDKAFFFVSPFVLPPLDIFLQFVIKKKFKSESKEVNLILFMLPMAMSLIIIGYEYIYMMIIGGR